MSGMLRRTCAILIILCTFASVLSGCKQDSGASSPSDVTPPDSPQVTPDDPTPPVTDDPVTPTPPDPTTPEIEWASYVSDYDEPFLPKDVFTPELYHSGIVPVKDGDKYRIEIRGEGDPSQTVVLGGEFGKCYEIMFTGEPEGIRIARINTDPRTLSVGSAIDYTSDDNVRYCMGKPTQSDRANLMYVCREKNEYLIIYTGSGQTAMHIYERTMLHDTDTDSNWWIPPSAGSITKTDGTFASYQWTSKKIIDNLYEPWVAKYPEYIERHELGYDQSGKFRMVGYTYTPESFDTTLFITGGMHGNEESAYFALAKLMQLIADATPDDPLLYTLRHKVRFIVVPVINVWGVSQNHDGTSAISRSRIRKNSDNVDLNRDFDKLTQRESQNVYNFFKQYAPEIDIALDFHNAATEGRSLYYNFINYSVNAVANYKTTNHFYHRLVELGYCKKTPDIAMIPGSYNKGSQYLEGRFWNEFKVPTITVEHFTNKSFPNSYSDKGLTMALEIYGNFVIQNALFFIDHNTK